jgi:hypothetical protein
MVTGVSTFQRVTCAAVLLLSIGVGVPGAAPRRHVRWADVLEQPASWYATAEAHAVADAVLLYQRASGGWPKDLDMTAPPPDPSSLPAEATIDNGATTTEVRLLALVGERRAVRSGKLQIEEEYPAWKERVTRRQRGSDIVDRPFEGRNGLPTAGYPAVTGRSVAYRLF